MGKNNSKDWRTLPPEYQWRFCADGYLAHPDGTIKSVDRWMNGPHGEMRLIKGKILKPIKDKNGYLVVTLSKDNKGKTYKVHRLVAQTFLPNPDNLPCINHIDEDKTNNRVENLEFCTYQYNNAYGTRIEKIKKKLRGRFLNRKDTSKSVVGIEPTTGKVVIEFPSTREAERNGYSKGAIAGCCRGDKGYRTYKGLIWIYKDNIPYQEELERKIEELKDIQDTTPKTVQAINPNTDKVVMEFSSTREADRNGYCRGNVSACCLGKRKTYKGLIWQYK